MQKNRLNKWMFLLLMFLVSSTHLFSQVHDVGRMLSYKKIAGGIEGKTATAIFDIRAYSDNTIRVRISKNKKLNDFSYALLSNEIPTYHARVNDNHQTIELSTKAITVIVVKAPSLRVIFKNKNGDVINEDQTGQVSGTTFIGDKVSSYKKLQEGERFVGLGEALGNLDKRGMAFTLNNTDTYKYGDPRLSMYISIPFYIGIHHRNLYGLFYNNTYKTVFNFGLSTPGFASITAEGGDADYFFFYDSTIAKIIDHYTSVTGKIPLPPKWSLGYHQSRCSYYPQEKVQWIAETFRRKQIPIDCIVLDADYQQDYQPFRINKERFPDLPGLAAGLAKMNIELTASVYPGVKIDSTYESYTDGLKKDIFIKYADGSLFETQIAPLRCYLPDYTNPKARAWWIDKMKWMQENGIHGYWNDMNEPAIGGSYLPDNLLFDFDGHQANALEAKNVYGFQMARSSFEAAIKFGIGKRPFVLTRSAFAGVQRYSAVWTGDNTASNDGLLSGVLLNNQLGLSGIPFVGPDLGGYIGDGTKDLFKRWIEVGVFSPFVRNHKEFFATANEPWSYGEEAEAISRTYISFRYRLMPYIYSKFYEASQTGMPIARSLCINYPFDDKVYDHLYQYQFLFGDAFMVIPVTTEEKSKSIYLPKGNWYNLLTDELINGEREWAAEFPIYRLPIYIKESSIIPLQSQVQSANEKPCDTLYLHIYSGERTNSFIYYEDDGSTFGYSKGNYYKRNIAFVPGEKKIIFQKKEGTFVSGFKKLKIMLHGFAADFQTIKINGVEKPLHKEKNDIFNCLDNLEDYYDKNYYQSLLNAQPASNTKSFIIDHEENEINIGW